MATNGKPTATDEKAKTDALSVKTKADSIGYIFDIIVVRLDITDKESKQIVDKDPTALSVHATFNKELLHITSSRINVVEFKSGKSFEFTENPSILRDDLTKNKLKLRIMYGTKKEIGVSFMDWPEGFTDCLVDPACGEELTHVFESEFKNCDTGKVGGVIEVIVRLQTKCREWTNDDVCVPSGRDLFKQANKIIDPNDILFVVGEEHNPCCCAQVGIIPATDSDKSLNPTCLDLSNFRAVNGQTVPNADILSCVDPACGQSENISNQYQQLIDSLMKKQKPGSSGAKKSDLGRSTSCMKQSEDRHCAGNQTACPSDSSSDLNNQGGQPCCCYGSDDEGAFAGENIVSMSRKETKPDMTAQIPVPQRSCPLCKENLSWLPRLAACPKCGYKPIPCIEQKPYDANATAEEILHDFLHKRSGSCENQSDTCFHRSSKGKCRCTCKPNKTCASCRIRKLCADVMNSTSVGDKCGKCENESSEQAFNICNTENKDCRPHLSRVFSELKDLYDIRESKRKGPEVNERCEKELNSAGPGKKMHKGKKRAKAKLYELEREREEFRVDTFRKSDNNCKSKQTYNYGTVRKYPGTKVGHKTCVNGFAGHKNVPSHMGWLWTTESIGLRAGWRPGAIRKPIKELMKYFLKDYPADTLRVSQYSYRKFGNGKDDCEDLVQQPTLHICKKNAEYYITLRPLKDPDTLKDCADPYLNMKPIQFRITENPLLAEKRKLKQCLKEMGFSKCTCHKPIVYCFCRNFLDKKRLEYQCNKEARNRNIPPCCDTLVLSDTTDSETEFDFGVTPPAGVIKPEKLRRRNYVNTATQYEENDWNVPPLYPKEPNKYMKLYNCAVGERFGPGFGPYGAGGYAPGVQPTGGVYGGCGGGGGGRGGRGGRGGFGPFGRGGRGGRGGARGGKAGAADGKARGGKVDMMKYLSKSKQKLSPLEAAEKRKKRMRELSGVPPPLLCMIDRRGKPFDPCAPMPMSYCYGDPCGHDNRIC